jgi:hypothetical protein
MRRYLDFEEGNLTHSSVSLDDNGIIEFDSDVTPRVLSTVLHKIYVGEATKAAALVKRYFHFEHPAIRKLFLKELVERISESPFWDDLRHINGWKESGACITEGCEPS